MPKLANAPRSLNRGTAIATSAIDDNSLAPAPGLRYDYSQIDPSARPQVMGAAAAIKVQEQRVRDGILIVGQRLTEVKSLIPHGQFSDWCATEFDMSQKTAQRMMRVAEVFGGKSDIVSFLSDTVLYALSESSTPEAARIAVIEEAQTAGSSPSVARTREVIAAHRPARVRYVASDEWAPPADDLPVRHIDAPDRSVVPSTAASTRNIGAALGKCSVCGRPLSDPVHAAAGCGPVCSARRAGNFVSAHDEAGSEAGSEPIALLAWAQRVHNNTHTHLSVLRDQFAATLASLPEYESVTGDYAGAADLREAVCGPLLLLNAMLTGDKVEVEAEQSC